MKHSLLYKKKFKKLLFLWFFSLTNLKNSKVIILAISSCTHQFTRNTVRIWKKKSYKWVFSFLTQSKSLTCPSFGNFSNSTNILWLENVTDSLCAFSLISKLSGKPVICKSCTFWPDHWIEQIIMIKCTNKFLEDNIHRACIILRFQYTDKISIICQ